MRRARLAMLVVIAALAVAACDRVVDLTAPPDAGRDGASTGDSGTRDGIPPDGGSFDGGPADGGGVLPDAGGVDA